MTEQDSMGGDERVARLIQAARELIDAYERKSTANEHFLKLEAAVDALGGTSDQTRADHDPAIHRPRSSNGRRMRSASHRPGGNGYPQGSGERQPIKRRTALKAGKRAASTRLGGVPGRVEKWNGRRLPGELPTLTGGLRP